MSIVTQKRLFTKTMVDFAAPDVHGVYGLYDSNDVPIYYGRAAGTDVTIKSRLLQHLAGDDGPCTQNASYFRYELATNAVYRETELLHEHVQRYGDLPRCNSRVG